MKEAREVEFEVLPKDTEETTGQPDPLLAWIARLMDNAFTVPGTQIRFGLDPILGLFPGFGDTVTALISTLLIVQSSRYGLPKIVLARMALNVLLNTTLGAVPIVGDAFSLWFKSNILNYALLQKHAGSRRRSTTRDWLFVGGLIGTLLAAIALILLGLFTLIAALFRHL